MFELTYLQLHQLKNPLFPKKLIKFKTENIIYVKMYLCA